ncbi:MAG: S-layer homology domain-containing protein [Oscillospiraceae bacterium]|nr:S-layer homology domain-containing protein [Oscillospiraceae bacterium]
MKRILSLLLCVVMLFSIAAAADSYGDVFGNNPQEVETKTYKQKFWDVDKSHWAFTAIAELSDRGAINGYTDGSFKPDRTVTRAEWAKIMVQAAGLQANDNSVRFSDMQGHWSIPYVNAAASYLTAFNDGRYRPDQAVTREDVTVAMVKLKGYDLGEVDYSVLSSFKDVASISNSIKVYVAIAVEKGLINGFTDGTFRGQATLTRAQAATLLWRAFQFGSDNKSSASDSSSTQGNQETPGPVVDSNPSTTPSQPGTALTVGALPGDYQDTVSGRAGMEIKKIGDTYKICIHWGSSASETAYWFFDATLDKATGKLVYENGFEFNHISNEDGTFTWDLQNDDCTGNFVLDGSLLVWNDVSEDLSGVCKFERTGTLQEGDKSQGYEEAKTALQKYLDVCMTVKLYEGKAEKESRIAKQYNQVLGLLLHCFGYKDSDELLEKVSAVHEIALKLPESIETVAEYNSHLYSFNSASASMRDSTLVVEFPKFKSSYSDATLKFAYDKSSFSVDVKKLSNYWAEAHPVARLFISIFATGYRDAELERLLNEEIQKQENNEEILIELYYGGYNLEISFEETGYREVTMTVTGTKGAKKPSSSKPTSNKVNTETKPSESIPEETPTPVTPEVSETEKTGTKGYDYQLVCNYCKHNDGVRHMELEYGVKTDVKWTCSACGKENWNYITFRW